LANTCQVKQPNSRINRSEKSFGWMGENYNKKDVIKKMDVILEIGKRYMIIYDDKGDHPKKKKGKVVSKENTLIKLDTGEVLNMQYILRAEELKW